MEPNDRILEENTARLLQAAVGKHARPSRRRRRQVLRMMMREAAASRQPMAQEFPDCIIVLLAGILIAALGYVVLQGIPAGDSMSLFQFSASVLVGINLILVPVASAIIVFRRRYVQTA